MTDQAPEIPAAAPDEAMVAARCVDPACPDAQPGTWHVHLPMAPPNVARFAGPSSG